MTTIQFSGSGYVFTTSGLLETQTCKSCGIPYAMPNDMLDWARSHPEVWFYCPNGHKWHYPIKTETEKLKEARDEIARVKAAHDQTYASLIGTRAAATRARNERDRLKTRAAHGVCPCCNRTFKQLAAHMKNKHPDFV